MSAQTRSEIADLLDKYGLVPSHRLGQHFLADGNITRKIVRAAAVEPGDLVVEVGAGTGTLTTALAGAGATVVAYEVDAALAPILSEVTEGLDVDLRITDITKVDLAEDLGAGEWKLVANLPYNVGTPLVLDSMRKHQQSIQSFVVMVQSEVAERFVAHHGAKSYGIPSVVAQLYTNPTIAFRVPPQVFYPPPRVESAVVVMPRIEPSPYSELAVELAGSAFGQRRKMLRRSLLRVLDDPVQMLEAAGIDPRLRAEDLPPQKYLDLAMAIS